MRYMVLRRRGLILCVLLFLAVGVAAVRGMSAAVQTLAAPQKHPIYSVETDKMEVSLGINCAWDNADIPRLIEILDRYNIKASFFVVGDWVDKYPESVKALYDAGHEIGSHSDTHADMTKLDRTGMVREIQDSCQKIEAITGQRVTLFRPPSGAYNATVVEVVRQQGLYPIQWDCDSIDYRNPTPAEMQQRILKKLRKGSIMLFHSGAKNTPEALPMIIESVQKQGYRFVQVSELIHKGDYTVDFEGRQHPASPQP